MVILALDGHSLDQMGMEAVTMDIRITQDVEQGFILVQKIQQAHQDLMHEVLGKVIEGQVSQVHMAVLVVAEQDQTPTMIVIKAVLAVILVEIKHLMLARVVVVVLTSPHQFQIKPF